MRESHSHELRDDSGASRHAVLPTSLVVRVPGRLQQPRARAHKRHAEPSATQSDGVSSTSESASSVRSSTCDVQAAPVKKRWYAVRKDEKRALEQELRRLQELKDLHAQSPASRTIAMLEQQQQNDQLRLAIMEQQLQLARAQSAITGTALAQPHSPFAKSIHLSTDWRDRAATLAQLKPSVLRDAEQYVRMRSAFLDPRVKYSHDETLELRNGDAVRIGFHSIPLARGFASVEQVLDALRQFYFNMEITYTEHSGEVMVREGEYDDVGNSGGDPDIKTQRLVRATAAGTHIESNAVLFCGLSRGAAADAMALAPHSDVRFDTDAAVVVVDAVNKDELYPYSPTTRVRQDTSAAICVRQWHAVDSSKASSSTDAMDSSRSATESPLSGFTLSGAFFARLHCAESTLPTDVTESMCFGSAFCFKTLVETLTTSAACT